jgi:hypothetical protein
MKNIFQRGKNPQQFSFQEIAEVLQDFVNADTWEDSKLIVQANQNRLLSDMADEVFVDFMQGYREKPEAYKFLQAHREVLQCCREIGIGPAFADRLGHPKRGVPVEQVYPAIQRLALAESWAERRKIVENNQEALLSEMADQILTHFLEDPDSQRFRETFLETRQLLRACRQHGIPAGFERMRTPQSPKSARRSSRR